MITTKSGKRTTNPPLTIVIIKNWETVIVTNKKVEIPKNLVDDVIT